MSSLPPATKSVSDNPAKMGVTEPHNQMLEKDVEKSMRLYAVIQAFRRGRMPDNRQIDDAFSYLDSHPPIDVNKLSPEGRKLVDDVRQLLEVSRLQVHDKNADEVLQKFIWHTSDEQFKETAKDKAQATVGDGSNLPAKEDAQRDGRQAVEHLRTLAQLLVTNSEARKLVSDLTLLARDFFATGAAKAAETARPDPERLTKVDDPAPSNAWGGAHTENNGELPSVAPDVDFQKDGFRGALKKGAQAFMSKADQKAHEKTQASIQRTQNSNAPTTQTGVASGFEPSPPNYATGTSAAPPLTTTGGYHPSQTVQRAEGTVEQKLESQPDDSSANASANQQAKDISSRVPQKHKERAAIAVDRTKQFFNEEFPQERRDQFIWRMKKVVTECQSHHSYQSAITWFLDTLEAYFNTAKSASKEQGRTAQGMFGNDPIVQQAWEELRVLLERLAGRRSLDGFFNAITKLKDDARSDEEFRAWFKRADEFVRRTLLEPGWILSPQYNKQASVIFRDQARHFFDERYHDHRQLVLDEAQYWVQGFAADPLNKRYGDAWAQLMKDLLMNSEGKLTWKSDLWRDVRNVILPEVAQRIGYVPIPRVEYTDNQLDLVIENLTLQGKNLFPNVIEFVGQTHVKMSPYKTIKDEAHSSMTLTLTQIQADMRDVAFYFRKKTGLPKLKDSGLADVFLGGKGITVKLKITTVTKDQQPKGASNTILRLESVVAKVDTLRFSIRDSKHDLLYKTMRPLATALIKKQICKAIEDGIRGAFEMVDAQMVAARDRVNDAQQSDASTLDQIKSAFSAPRESASSAVSDVSSKAEKRNSRFKVVASRESSLLPSVGHPRGWASKAPTSPEDEKVDAPWKSHAFDAAPASAGTDNLAEDTTGAAKASDTSAPIRA